MIDPWSHAIAEFPAEWLNQYLVTFPADLLAAAQTALADAKYDRGNDPRTLRTAKAQVTGRIRTHDIGR